MIRTSGVEITAGCRQKPTGTVMEIEKALINDRLRVSKVF